MPPKPPKQTRLFWATRRTSSTVASRTPNTSLAPLFASTSSSASTSATPVAPPVPVFTPYSGTSISGYGDVFNVDSAEDDIEDSGFDTTSSTNPFLGLYGSSSSASGIAGSYNSGSGWFGVSTGSAGSLPAAGSSFSSIPALLNGTGILGASLPSVNPVDYNYGIPRSATTIAIPASMQAATTGTKQSTVSDKPATKQSTARDNPATTSSRVKASTIISIDDSDSDDDVQLIVPKSTLTARVPTSPNRKRVYDLISSSPEAARPKRHAAIKSAIASKNLLYATPADIAREREEDIEVENHYKH